MPFWFKHAVISRSELAPASRAAWIMGAMSSACVLAPATRAVTAAKCAGHFPHAPLVSRFVRELSAATLLAASCFARLEAARGERGGAASALKARATRGRAR
jgi:hypothetical protein